MWVRFVIKLLISLKLIFGLVFPLSVHGSTSDSPIDEVERNYSTKTNQELSNLLASWGKLSPTQRRALLAETRGRLIDQNENQLPEKGKVSIKVQRRYGRVIKNADGRALVVQTQVTKIKRVEKRPLGKKQAVGVRSNSNKGVPYDSKLDPGLTHKTKSGAVRVAYGTGFEKRIIKKATISESQPLNGKDIDGSAHAGNQ